MKKAIYQLKLNYTYNPDHKGAPYTLDGQHWMNKGEYLECAIKSVLGYEPVKQPNASYDKVSDIEEIKASIKTDRFTLSNKILADDFENSIEEYFKTTDSQIWLYGIQLDEDLIIYEMNKNEFKSFLKEFSSLNERGVIRGKKTSFKMLLWLESRI